MWPLWAVLPVGGKRKTAGIPCGPPVDGRRRTQCTSLSDQCSLQQESDKEALRTCGGGSALPGEAALAEAVGLLGQGRQRPEGGGLPGEAAEIGRASCRERV